MNIVLGSFGTAKGYKDKAFTVQVESDPNVPVARAEKPLRYGKLEEIHHIFRADPKSPPLIITLFFTAAVLVTLPALLGTVSSSQKTFLDNADKNVVAVPWW